MQLTVRKPSLFEKPTARDNNSFNSDFVKWEWGRSGWKSKVTQCVFNLTEKKTQCKLKRSVSAPKCKFSPAGQSLIQPLLEPFEHNLGQNSSIKRLFQPTLVPISSRGSKSALGSQILIGLYFTHRNGRIFRAKTDLSDLQYSFDLLLPWVRDRNMKSRSAPLNCSTGIVQCTLECFSMQFSPQRGVPFLSSRRCHTPQ